MESELSKIKLPNNFKIVTSGGGRVASGITEILNNSSFVAKKAKSANDE